MHAIILSGGVGSRLWPVSRKMHPKPFIVMPDGLSILQSTFLRVLELAPTSIVNVTGSEFVFKIKSEWEALSHPAKSALEPSYILEPFGKSTAAAVAMACLSIAKTYSDDEVLLVLPSDHLIVDQAAFNDAVDKADALALQGKIVTFGMKPLAPETGYGYLEYVGNEVTKFIEKPSLKTAKEYLKSNRYLWNSGMLCFKASVMLQEMAQYCPDILAAVTLCLAASHGNQQKLLHIDPYTFEPIRAESIDCAVMEKSDKIAVIPCDMGWSDIGTWSTLSQILSCDGNGNILNGEAVIEKVSNCYIEGGNRLIAAVGIDNLVIVDTPDALLVAHKDHTQDVKNIYNSLAKAGHQTHATHTIVYRPWGSYTVLEEGANFKIKRIEVNASASLSLQMHQYRSEHWIVVAGRALVLNDENEFSLDANQSVYIPAGNMHRLSNGSSADKLIIIEVQTGSYLGEDDIFRFEERYKHADQKLAHA
jgi:mannose-1-phosphate guanylyltransferase/mannose-6-phosphate isomerase